ncbi:16S rRNA (guanine(966)-N(2))-methyltransferase RsmD [Pseudalkalibacillus caeni]|uniref:16S rRNA (Guanine(966)-N(2))-methyltransferase RsmD n=1 Tax=Exobacillus caeni TaxID=2574798 RepID=A0A5R9F4L6_9BACL|nr:16S rRNA (guanine(966)-N(2))-methyltransferase RsmD [Pseudalkalibacillus caeni]TLS37971.1 16S rRNA (guanine(966)-N(2))-methyltransferase RsmD [Pseudalkalibacillus caeni]
MRIIAGECKGRHLKPVPGQTTRPTTDKVRESIFNMIGPFFESGTVLDLYGGSGALGIEALSRGMDHLVTVDRDSKAIEVIKWNLAQCGYLERTEVYRNDSNRALKALKKRDDVKFSLVLLDPPYHKQRILSDLEKITSFDLLLPEAQIVVEHLTDVELPENLNGLNKIKFETYSGKTGITIYRYELEMNS